jgi:hypothetical protein
MLKGFLFDFVLGLIFRRTKRKVIDNFKTQGIVAYLKVLQGARLSIAGALILFVVLQFIVFGFVAMTGAGIWLLPMELESKIYLILALGAILFFVPLGLIIWAFSEKVWYSISGAEKIVSELLNKKSA